MSLFWLEPEFLCGQSDPPPPPIHIEIHICCASIFYPSVCSVLLRDTTNTFRYNNSHLDPNTFVCVLYVLKCVCFAD